MLKSLGNKMDMCHRPVTETYRWPIMAVVESVDTIIWNNGENRLLAAGVRWDRPCDNFNLVVLANNENQARAILDQPREIESDDDLISLLGVQDRCRIQTRLHWKNGRYAFSIDDIGATETFKHTREDSVEWVRRFVAWRQKYGSNPRLRVYCKDPSQIRNGTQHWSVEWAGPNTQSIQDVFNQQQDPDLHTLIIASGQEIFIDDLFLWVNLDHSVWQDHQNRCTLMRKYFAWSACKITVSSHATQ